jgi:hypothetical protein
MAAVHANIAATESGRVRGEWIMGARMRMALAQNLNHPGSTVLAGVAPFAELRFAPPWVSPDGFEIHAGVDWRNERARN